MPIIKQGNGHLGHTRNPLIPNGRIDAARHHCTQTGQTLSKWTVHVVYSLSLVRNYSPATVGRRQWVGRVRWLGCRTGGPTRAGLPALLTQFPGSIVSAKVMTWRTHSCVPRRHSCRRPFRQVVTATGVRQAEWRVFVKKSGQGGGGGFACQPWRS